MDEDKCNSILFSRLWLSGLYMYARHFAEKMC